MKQIVVVSGKGGTGKTVITASFASLAKNKVMVDCDVDAADLDLLLHPNIKETYKFTGKVAKIDQDKCDRCGKCQETCRFEAINKINNNFVIDSVSCEGCGVCVYVCPQRAVKMVENPSGRWFVSETKYGPLVHAKLGVAEENSGKLVSLVKQRAKSIAEDEKKNLIIIDGPPGIGCPVIASLSGVDIALIVTEPTLSGIHDLERVLGVANHFGIKSLVCINKYDLNLENTQKIKSYCQDWGIEVAGEIPFDIAVTKALVMGKPIVEYSDGSVSRQIRNLWEKVLKVLLK